MLKLTAVKYLKDDASDTVRTSFMKEAQTLASFDHPNIVSLLGICTDNKGPLCMVLGKCFTLYSQTWPLFVKREDHFTFEF